LTPNIIQNLLLIYLKFNNNFYLKIGLGGGEHFLFSHL